MPWTAPPPKLCTLCLSKVYPVEELYTDGTLYHKKCFRCQTCYKAREQHSQRRRSTALHCSLNTPRSATRPPAHVRRT